MRYLAKLLLRVDSWAFAPIIDLPAHGFNIHDFSSISANLGLYSRCDIYQNNIYSHILFKCGIIYAIGATADVPVRVRGGVVAVRVGKTTIPDTVVQVAEAKALA